MPLEAGACMAVQSRNILLARTASAKAIERDVELKIGSLTEGKAKY